MDGGARLIQAPADYIPLTLSATIASIRDALIDYIEATYHLGHPDLVRQRRQILDDPGVVFQHPYLESTPRYVSGEHFAHLGLRQPALELLSVLCTDDGETPALLHNPPYSHQAAALIGTLGLEMSLAITTGTGSGKTESFLMPILGKLAIEANESPASFAAPAVRALLLYPMNALVNDQLGRLRLLLGDPRVVRLFEEWAGRPARFARYTSRTLYPGVRKVEKDQTRLRPIERFYIDLLERAAGPESNDQRAAASLVRNLRQRGKWPAKPDLRAWFGARSSRWQNRQGDFIRAVTLPHDAELLTRHEVLAAPPDVLVTNYSMLEYMLMRPLERPVFDATRDWLEANENQRLLLVIDEAHLYRGAGGAEVGLLLRRLANRLAVPPERIQVICTSASFTSPDRATAFASKLSGRQPEDFIAIEGELALKKSASKGSEQDARRLAALDLADFYSARDDGQRRLAVNELLTWRNVTEREGASVAADLYSALVDYPPLGLLINLTMQQAMPLDELGREVFDTEDQGLGDRALSVMIALASYARERPSQPGLLPCRIHSFFRGLPGLWACLDANCTAARSITDDRPTGRIYSQPIDTCLCGARVFELFTCRHCGAAYARSYTDNVAAPSFLWAEPGTAFLSATGVVSELVPLDLCLEVPLEEGVEPADLDLETGRLNPEVLGPRSRQVFIPRDRDANRAASSAAGAGEFRPCAVCGKSGSYGRSSVQDHQTKGDQPFQALISRQIEVQPPGETPYSEFAPLRGRKVLAFSDSRQTAARLAPNLQTYSLRDVLRPLIVAGYRDLSEVQTFAPALSLEDLFLAVLLAAARLQVRLRPQLQAGESMHVQREVAEVVAQGRITDSEVMLQLLTDVRAATPPRALLRGLVATITDKYYGLQSLALATLAERIGLRQRLLDQLPNLGDHVTTTDSKLALTRQWLSYWIDPGIWFRGMPPTWWQAPEGVDGHTGRFAAMRRWLQIPALQRDFERNWLPHLLDIFCEPAGSKFRMRAVTLTLDLSPDWAYCRVCRATQRPFPGSSRCAGCGRDTVMNIDPELDDVFRARKSYYRASTTRALAPQPAAPLAVIASEHTAQLNAAQADEVFSKAEEHELLFQDVNLSPEDGRSSAIDVLSCTTTMEVGIDIGALSGVALRNMPPARSNYQQRAGRSGRRGNAVATVIAFGSVDSHDEHYFREPDSMIRGAVEDPDLTLDNFEIAARHVTAFLLQAYHRERLPEIRADDQPQLFEVLGSVASFKRQDSVLNRFDFEAWLRSAEHALGAQLREWLPRELASQERERLIAEMVERTLAEIDGAIDFVPQAAGGADGDGDQADVVDVPAEVGEERARPERAVGNLLDRLLYKGVLPRYAFPTDVVSFHVFDRDRSTPFRPEFLYAPGQGLAAALSQYAPGKEVWIDSKLWFSGALYSPMRSELHRAWEDRRLYFECSLCHYAKTESYGQAEKGERRDCPACGGSGTFGEAKNWLRPPGFAHPQNMEEGTSPDDQPARSYATRAKLVAPGPADTSGWTAVTDRIRLFYKRDHLLVSNTGPRQEGYSLCVRCGLIEPTAQVTHHVPANHEKPYPDRRDQACGGAASTRGLVLGTDFITDVALIGVTVDYPLSLLPGYLATGVALRTLCEALSIASTRALEVDQSELQAEFRPALTPNGRNGLEAEIYLYDTLAGGAGFARRVVEVGRPIFDEALRVLESCPAGCDRSCYRCLRSFRNRFEHDQLDRHLGASLLRYLLSGEPPALSATRIEAATDKLYADLSRTHATGIEFERQAMVEVPGLGTISAPILARAVSGSASIIAVHNPLTPDHVLDQSLAEAKEFGLGIPVILVDEIVVARNLPHATRQVLHTV